MSDQLAPENNMLEVIIPITAAALGIVGTLIALFWNKIERYHKKNTFQNLVLRELEEFKPFPVLPQSQLKSWSEYARNKRFIHKSILQEPDGSLDFVLSLDPDLVYFVSQLWFHADKPTDSSDQFLYFWGEIEKYFKTRSVHWTKIQKAHAAWSELDKWLKIRSEMEKRLFT
jgi:hypothetical protein